MPKKNKKSKKKKDLTLDSSKKVKAKVHSKKSKKKAKNKKSQNGKTKPSTPSTVKSKTASAETPKPAVQEKPENNTPEVNITAVYDTFNRIIDLVNNIADEPVTYGDEIVHRAEIRALEQIKEDEPVNMLTLSGHLGITKSAVLKTINKLDYKGLINKQITNEPFKIIILTTTEEGRKFLSEKPPWGLKKKNKITNALSKLNETDLAQFNGVLERLLTNLR